MTCGVSGPARILIAEDEESLARVIAQHLTRSGHACTVVTGGRDALAALHRQSFDLALLDIAMPSPDGLEVLRTVQHEVDRPEVVIMTGNGTIDTAVQAMKLGAFAYLSKPYRMAELDVVVARALERRALEHENAHLRDRVARNELATPLATTYAPLRAVLEMAERAAATDDPVLIVGPAGVGKYALARSVHRRSPRGRGPFVAITVAELRTPDAARRLFGRAARDGEVVTPAALSTTGTLYLGDLTALSGPLQARLARALATGAFRAEAGAMPWPVRARVVAAIRGTFEDATARLHPELATRLGAVRVVLPPLVERRDDIEGLAMAFVHEASAGAVTVAPSALAALRAHDWPGNASEVRAVLARALAAIPAGELTARDLPIGAPSRMPLDEVERRHIAMVLEAEGWHQGRAADILGISPKTLYRKIREYGMQRPSAGGGA